MRLVCPNCDATYEVPDSVIPPYGRDVQCSNCGTSWFFNPAAPDEPEPPTVYEPEPEPEPVAAPEPEPAAFGDEIAEPPVYDDLDDAPEYEPEPAPPPVAPPEVEAPPVAAPQEEPESDTADIPAPPDDIPQRRQLDQQIAEILRQEAEFENRARAEDAGLEYQDDLPLDPPERGQAPAAADAAAMAVAAGSRRDLLPDIDEINSTLRATTERQTPVAASPEEVELVQKRRSGFRTGFGLALLILGTGAGLYGNVDTISAAAPGMADQLASFENFVNAGRQWLQSAVEGLAESIDA